MKTIRLLFCMALVCCVSATQAAADERKYKIGENGGFPPFDIVPGEGVDHDILTALCEANTNMTCKLKAVTVTDCVDFDETGNQITGPALVEGRVDGCIGWFDTPTRRQLGMEFGEIFSRGTTPQLIARDEDTTFDTLGPEGDFNDDVIIGFLKGFFNDAACLNTRYEGNFQTQFFSSEQERASMVTALRGGTLSLVFWDNLDTVPEGTHPVGERIEVCGPALSLATYPPSQRRKRKSDNLRRDFNCGLALIRENGELEAICNRWIEDGFNPACILEGPPPTVQCVEDNLADSSSKREEQED